MRQMTPISEYLKTNIKLGDPHDPKQSWNTTEIANWVDTFCIKEYENHIDVPMNELYYVANRYTNVGVSINIYRKEKGKLDKVGYCVNIRPEFKSSVKGDGFEDFISFDNAVTIAKKMMLAETNEQIVNIVENYKKYI